MAKSRLVSRRGFLVTSVQAGAAAVAAPMILPSGVLAAAGKPGANDRIAVGYIGVGRRALEIMRLPTDAQTVAVSDVNKPRMDEVVGDKGWKKYWDYREMLADPAIDAVIIATPDHWHAINAVHACEAGKDVYVEKPMTLTIREGRAMVDAARKNKRIVQVGSQQRSMEACRTGCELVRNGRIGKVHTVYGANYPSPWDCPLPEQPVPDGLNWDMWCGQTQPRPYHIELYTPRVRGQEAGWISYRPYSGGEMTGWGAHGLDIIQWALGMDETGPVEVSPVPGTEYDDGVHKGPTCEVVFKYANDVVVHLNNKGPEGGGLFVGDKGRIAIERGKYKIDPESLAAEPLKDTDIRLYKSDDHMKNWLDCIRSRELSVADVEIGHRTTTMCHLGNIARWTGRKLTWDPAKERFVDDDDANTYIERPMREPWTLKFA